MIAGIAVHMLTCMQEIPLFGVHAGMYARNSCECAGLEHAGWTISRIACECASLYSNNPPFRRSVLQKDA